MIALLVVFFRPELLTEGIKEPITDSQGTLHWVMGQGVGWAWAGSQALPPRSCFLCSGPILPWHSPTTLPIGFTPTSYHLCPWVSGASCLLTLASLPRPQRGIPGTLLWTRA